jgi:dUTP pyrophosphatase
MAKALLYKRFDKSVPAPLQATAKSAGIDLYSRENIQIMPQQVVLVPLNVALKPPVDHWLMLVARSSLHKMGLLLVTGIGVGDEDFSGDLDEYQAALFNFSKVPVTVKKGERIVQLIVAQKIPVELIEVQKMGNPTRGGFGSTGKK